MNRVYSQGGVKIPTGGYPFNEWRARERSEMVQRSSRSGVIPEPTVIVRMKEDKAVFIPLQVFSCCAVVFF